MGPLATLLLVTIFVHSLLAAAVFIDAKRTGRPTVRWTALTLLAGVFGAGAYYYTR